MTVLQQLEKNENDEDILTLPRRHQRRPTAAAMPRSPIAPTASPADCASSASAQGDSVCILMRNDIAFIEAAYAAMRLGAYGVPVNWHFKPEEINYILKDSGTPVLIGHADMLHQLRDAIPAGVTVLSVPTPPEILGELQDRSGSSRHAGFRHRFRTLAASAGAL